MELFKDNLVDTNLMIAKSVGGPTRMPLKVLNGPLSVSSSSNVQKGPSEVRSVVSSSSSIALHLSGSDVKPRIVHGSSYPGLELRLGTSDTADNSRQHTRFVPGSASFPSKIQIGTVGSCLDAQSQVAYAHLQRKTRRPKQPTVIMKPGNENKETETKPVLPCGVLGDLKPGIIGRVRDSKHVHSIIGAVLGSKSVPRKRVRENPVAESQKPLNQPCKQVKREEQQSDSLSLEAMFIKEEEMDTLGTAEPKSRTNMVTDSEMATSADDIATESCETLEGLYSQEGGKDVKLERVDEDFEDSRCSSLNYSNPAAVWLKLVNQDLKGRISALKRSRRRVRTAIVAKDENVFTAAGDLCMQGLNQQEDPAKAKRQYELQMDRWKALFVSMDSALGVEAANLEGHWRRLQEMESQLLTTASAAECVCDKQPKMN